MTRLTKIACGIGAALALSYGGVASAAVPVNTGLAESILNVSNFTIRIGDNAATRSSTLIGVDGDENALIPIPDFNCDPTLSNCVIKLLSVTSNGDTFSELGGGTDSASSSGILGSTFSLTSYVGANGEGVDFANPGTPVAGNPTGTYMAGASITLGNAIVDEDNIIVHSVGSLTNTGSASGQSNQGLKSTTFTVIALQNTLLEMAFDADGFLRTALGQPGINSNASYSWNLTIDEFVTIDGVETSRRFLTWTPSGGASNIDGRCTLLLTPACTEFERGFIGLDDEDIPLFFSLNDGISTGLTDDITRSGAGGFQVEALFTAGRKYTLQLTHSTIADVEIVAAIPEPGTLALLGAGLMGIGLRRRKVA